MSTMNDARGQFRLVEEQPRKSRARRCAPWVVAALLILGAVMATAEIQWLPTFSANDFGSILFGAG